MKRIIVVPLRATPHTNIASGSVGRRSGAGERGLTEGASGAVVIGLHEMDRRRRARMRRLLRGAG
jgi:hypothetical protein